MKFLERDRQMLERFLPGLDERLRALPLEELEKRGNGSNEGIRSFRELGGTGMVIPKEDGGLGSTPLEAVRIQRAIGSRSPSLAVATTMHHMSVATVVEMCANGWDNGSGAERMLLQTIAEQRLLLASAFAEGRPGASIVVPQMSATRAPDGFAVTGSKKPCSLTWSADILTASVRLPPEGNGPGGGEGEIAVAVIPADAPGIERRQFWRTDILAGAESDEVHLQEVFVPEYMLARTGTPDQLDRVMIGGLLWFELLISASYLGTASALVERSLDLGKTYAGEIAQLAIEVEGAMVALEGMAQLKLAEPATEDLFVRMLAARFAVQSSVERASARAVELLGGSAFSRSCDVSYLFAAARALAFHPPHRIRMAPALMDYYLGEPLRFA